MSRAVGLIAGLLTLGACDTVYYYGERPSGGDDGDTTPPLAVSCRALHLRSPELGDGVYAIAPEGVEPRDVHCDMTQDGGGWTLMRPSDVVHQVDYLVTATSSVDGNGGLLVTVDPQVEGCGDGQENPQHLVDFEPGFPWTHVRARYAFSGSVSCWSLFGDLPYCDQLAINLVPFDAGVDSIRNQVRMGGSAGDAYTGGGSGPTDNTRCDNTLANFWYRDNGLAERSAVVTLRRADLGKPAGVVLGAGCIELNPATLWRYSEIYVR